MTTSRKTMTKAARAIALGYAIQQQLFDPKTVNMADLAEAFGVHRGTIMRDLREVEAMLETAKQYQARIRSLNHGESHRRG